VSLSCAQGHASNVADLRFVSTGSSAAAGGANRGRSLSLQWNCWKAKRWRVPSRQRAEHTRRKTNCSQMASAWSRARRRILHRDSSRQRGADACPQRPAGGHHGFGLRCDQLRMSVRARQSRLREVLGTPAYMSPEQVKERTHAGFRRLFARFGLVPDVTARGLRRCDASVDAVRRIREDPCARTLVPISTRWEC